MKTARPNKSELASFVDEGMTLEGTITFRGSLRLEGTIRGRIEGGQELVVDRKGRIEGTVQAERVYVHGCLQGEEIRCDRLEVFPGGRVEGRIVVRGLVVHEGGILQGECKMEEVTQPKLVATQTR